MNKTLALIATLGIMSSSAYAADTAKPAEAVKAPVEKTITKTATTEVTKTTLKEVAPVNAELKDGTKVVIKGESVFVIAKDGKETPAPDAKHELKDGTFVTTIGGKIVK